MPLYEVVVRCYLPIPNSANLSRHYEIGETVEYSGTPGRALSPLDDAARTAVDLRNAEVPYEFLPNGLQMRHRGTGTLVGGTITTMRHKPSEPGYNGGPRDLVRVHARRGISASGSASTVTGSRRGSITIAAAELTASRTGE